jgi:HEPN domain-containing protein
VDVRAERVIEMFEKRGDVEAIQSGGTTAARASLERARQHLEAAELLVDAGKWEPAFTTAYDAYRMAAESIVIALGYRVPAVKGAHRITADIADAALGDSAVFTAASAEQFRSGRHDAEYFDPDRPAEKTEADARWALDLAQRALSEVESALR